jgi:hypothetical protein
VIFHVPRFLLPVHIIAHDHLLKSPVPFHPVHHQKLPLHIIHGLHHDQKFFAHDQNFLKLFHENCADVFAKVVVAFVVKSQEIHL